MPTNMLVAKVERLEKEKAELRADLEDIVRLNHPTTLIPDIEGPKVPQDEFNQFLGRAFVAGCLAGVLIKNDKNESLKNADA